MKRNKNSESRDDCDGPGFDEPANELADWASTPAGQKGEPSPHLKPGEKSWVEVEEERRRKGLPARELAGAPPAPPRRTGTGLFYKSGDEIAPTHPDHGPMHLLPRQEDGSFAAYYYCSKEELGDFGIDGPPPRRYRKDGFTPERIEIFIATLHATASVSDAARAAGISRKAAYDLYNRADAEEFRCAWDEALRGPNIVLTSTAYDRAINGVEEIVYYQGQRVGVRIKYDNRLLMWLLKVRDPLNFAPLGDLRGWLRHRDIEPHRPIEPILDRLAAAEEEWGRHLADEATGPPRLERPGDALAPRSEPDGAGRPDDDEDTPPRV